MNDIHVDRMGSIVGLTPLTHKARRWLEDNCQIEDWQQTGATINVDVRMAVDILDGMEAAGFIITG